MRGVRRVPDFIAIAALGAVVAAGIAGSAAAKGTGMAFVSNEKTNDLTIIDPKTMTVVGSIKTSHRPRDMHFNRDKTLIYVACGDDDVIDVVDVAQRKVIDQIPTGPSPETFRLSADNSTIYVSNEENSSLQVITVKDKIITPRGADGRGARRGRGERGRQDDLRDVGSVRHGACRRCGGTGRWSTTLSSARGRGALH